MKTLEGHEDNVRVLAVGDRHVFSGSWDKTIRVWDLETLECTKVHQCLLFLHPFVRLARCSATPMGACSSASALVSSHPLHLSPCCSPLMQHAGTQ